MTEWIAFKVLPHLFNHIDVELEGQNITGWCEPQKAFELAAMVCALKPSTIVELGVWGGRSFLPMAMACAEIKHGIAIAVDPWSPQASVEGYDAPNVEWWSKQDHEAIYNRFLAHVQRLGLTERVVISRFKSDEAPLPESIHLLHVDGQHSDQALRDVKRWTPRVPICGVVVMDDLDWVVSGKPCVKIAVEWLLNAGFRELHRTKTEKGSWGFFMRETADCI